MRDFSALLKAAQPGDLLIYNHNSAGLLDTLADDAIDFFENGKANHASIVKDCSNQIEAQTSGVRTSPINEYFGIVGCAVTLRRPLNIHQPQPRWAVDFAVSQVGSKYGWAQDAYDGLDLIAEKVGIHWFSRTDLSVNMGRLCCSGLCAVAWEKAGKILVPGKLSNNVVPSDLLTTQEAETIAEVL